MHRLDIELRRRRTIIAGILAALCFAAGVGDTLYVGRRTLPIRAGKFAFDKVLGTANQGDTLKVTGVEGRFLKVVFTPAGQPPVEGYVMESALSVDKPVIVTTRAAADNDTLASVNAGKGHLDSKEFAVAKGLSQEPLQTMEKESEKVMSDSDTAFIEFMKAGKIGTFKPTPGATQ